MQRREEAIIILPVGQNSLSADTKYKHKVHGWPVLKLQSKSVFQPLTYEEQKITEVKGTDRNHTAHKWQSCFQHRNF